MVLRTLFCKLVLSGLLAASVLPDQELAAASSAHCWRHFSPKPRGGVKHEKNFVRCSLPALTRGWFVHTDCSECR